MVRIISAPIHKRCSFQFDTIFLKFNIFSKRAFKALAIQDRSLSRSKFSCESNQNLAEKGQICTPNKPSAVFKNVKIHPHCFLLSTTQRISCTLKRQIFSEYVENKNQMSIHILFENNKTELLTEAILMSVKSFKYIQNSQKKYTYINVYKAGGGGVLRFSYIAIKQLLNLFFGIWKNRSGHLARRSGLFSLLDNAPGNQVVGCIIQKRILINTYSLDLLFM